MKKQKTTPFPFRPIYAALLVVLAGLLWLVAQPTPGLRVTVLSPVLAPDTAPPPPATPARIRVATYNLEHFTDGRNDEPERTPEIFMTHARDAAAIITEANPDILVLQEIENGRVLEYLNTQFEEPYPYIYITRLRQSSGDNERLNLALLSRIPPREVRQLGFAQLGGRSRPARGALAAEFRLDDDSALFVYDIHLKSNFGEAPRNQAQRGIALHHIAADAIAQALPHTTRGTPVYTVILGDTNVDPDNDDFATDPSLNPLAATYTDLWRGYSIEERTTIPTRQPGPTGDPLMVFPPAAFDRIFASRNLMGGNPWLVSAPQVIQKGTDTTANDTQPGFNGHISDHYLAFADLEKIQ